MKYLYLALLLIIASCSTGAKIVTMESFSEIPIGATTSEVIATSGEPYAIRNKSDGSMEYEYIERIKVGGRDIEVRHYYLTIKRGVVVSKRIEESSPAPYRYDSYEMQTTQN